MYDGITPAKRNLNGLSHIKHSIMRMARMIVNITNDKDAYPSILNFSTTEPTAEKNKEEDKISELSNNISNLFVSVVFYVLTSMCTLLITKSISCVGADAMKFITNLLNNTAFENEIVLSAISIFVTAFIVQIIFMLFNLNAWKDSICLIYKNSRKKILGVILFIISVFTGMSINTVVWISLIVITVVFLGKGILKL
ncbi:hypothetical protein NEPAR06_0651 [Nematocida parisii]|uniref:Uncharacterized protein n=1 Tax=Nematocida parisii (strain ERTm3) TaxID=935791 RepID=I3EEZ6_NEMP3|nr:uncharacterized protein NEPG_01973 [Nematocida parisii ERTm1]EIJ87793.1 hypothetical protein NEQG_01865 [Nematocida parisii ERTm3]KAI5143552.1 hypothetical protein NEPAR07_0681 [Nematocida parisii]EIJ93018.1 hypothetical protein NEPG_01973 [Nematocida parisii ERTm1]KAI5153672.1 hypothetical protein NEPAR06_0651 [Nematocida parisii]KAI5156574.1 hypothetical protein NEPAR05_0689 [Nematocida parisii]|eukprot:XP_013059801.1 hypothetical protein NEPG_01973 [Nematocida parisii ERTm1]